MLSYQIFTDTLICINVVRGEELGADGGLPNPLAAQHDHPVDGQPHLPGGGRRPARPLTAGAAGAAVLR